MWQEEDDDDNDEDDSAPVPLVDFDLDSLIPVSDIKIFENK